MQYLSNINDSLLTKCISVGSKPSLSPVSGVLLRVAVRVMPLEAGAAAVGTATVEAGVGGALAVG